MHSQAGNRIRDIVVRAGGMVDAVLAAKRGAFAPFKGSNACKIASRSACPSVALKKRTCRSSRFLKCARW